MPGLDRPTLERIEKIEKEIGRLRNRDRAPNSLVLRDGVTAPSVVVGVALIYVDIADGDLKIKFSDGTVKTIVVDT